MGSIREICEAIEKQILSPPNHAREHRKGHLGPCKGCSFDQAAEQCTNYMSQFIQQNRRERITLRKKVESSSELFDWKVVRSYYDRAHDLALKRLG